MRAVSPVRAPGRALGHAARTRHGKCIEKESCLGSRSCSAKLNQEVLKKAGKVGKAVRYGRTGFIQALGRLAVNLLLQGVGLGERARREQSQTDNNTYQSSPVSKYKVRIKGGVFSEPAFFSAPFSPPPLLLPFLLSQTLAAVVVDLQAS